jgi:AAA+ superfamily predicted ATPase
MEYEQLIIQLRKFCLKRLEHYLRKRKDAAAISDFSLTGKISHPLFQLIKKHEMTKEEQLLIAIAFIPHLDPNFFNGIIHEVLPEGADLPIFGCVKGKNHRGFIPTGETAIFLLGGVDIKERLRVIELLKNSELIKQEVLIISPVEAGEPDMSGKLYLSAPTTAFLLSGREILPELGPEFPAQKIDTAEEWESLVLPEEVMAQIEELKTWINFNKTLMEEWGMHKKLKPGYRVLFHGPSGTGKTLTATLLGKHTGRPVFRIDVSTIVSKYIGETEKNLEKLFKKAENKEWILFFDEADALFGKRTEVSDSHDRYANQEVSYLLQRVENFPGLVILSTNYKSNIDEAFVRRFNSVIKFPFPDVKMREKLWKSSFPEKAKFGKQVDFTHIASSYKLTGGSIINAVHQTCLKTISSKKKIIPLENILHGIRREVEKEGKVFNKHTVLNLNRKIKK